MKRSLLLAGVLAVMLVPPTAARPDATCTAKQKADRIAALAAYKKKMPAERRAYFRTHPKPADRKRFVARQQARLKALQRAAACTLVTPPPPAPPPVAPSTVQVSAAVPTADADQIRSGVTIAAEFLRKIGAPPTWRYDFYAEHELEAMIQLHIRLGATEQSARAIWNGGVTAMADRSVVLLRTTSPSWLGLSREHRLKLAGHELFHTLQYTLAGACCAGPDTIRWGPVWLTEGAAEFIGGAAVVDVGLAAPTYFHDDLVQFTRRNGAGVTLRSPVTRGDANARGYVAYALGALAVELLTKQRGPSALLEYHRQIGAGKGWDEAFQAAYGKTLDAFYAEFEAYRQTL